MTSTAARFLATALLADTVAEQREAVARACPSEPGLLLWVCCRAASALPPPADDEHVVDWLQTHLEVVFWPEGPSPVVPAADAEQWLRLARTTLARSAESGLNVTEFAADWLRQGALSESAASSPDLIGPAWLHAAGTEGGEEREVPPIDEADLARWTKSVDDAEWVRLLPGLAARSHRLHLLENDFQAALSQEKMFAMRELAYGASHEINNPLANISTRAQTLLRDEEDPERRRRLATIVAQAFRAHEMIADMMLYAKPPDLQPQEVSTDDLIRTVVQEMDEQAAGQGTELTFQADWSGELRVDPTHLAVAIKSLVRNSLEALDVGGRIQIVCRTRPDHIEIEVADTGPGIPSSLIPRIFDPFFSGREAGRGLGLGLSKSWRIATLHGGTIEVDHTEQGGARFCLRLPAELIVCPSIPTAG